MDDEKKVLPLRDAYTFGAEHGLEHEITAIRNMEIEWDLSYNASVRRGYVIDLFKKNQLFDAFKQRYWIAGDREPHLEIQDEEEDQAFAAEAHLRDYLAHNLDRVEPGLRLYAQGGQNGIEFPVESGRIPDDLVLAVQRVQGVSLYRYKLSFSIEPFSGQ